MEDAIATKTKKIQTNAKVLLKAIKLLREVTSLLSEGDSEPDQPAAEQICQTHGQVAASVIVQSVRNSHFLLAVLSLLE